MKDTTKTILEKAKNIHTPGFTEILEIGIVLAIAVFFLTTLTNGHNWGDDFAMYIAHAKNIVEGRPFADTYYIYNPNFADLGPKAYPPFFPLLLTPVFAITGMNFLFLKSIGILCFAIFLLFFIGKVTGKSASPGMRILLLLFLGLNPVFWEISDEILSDIPFLLITYLALYQIQKASLMKESDKGKYVASIAAGLLIYLSYATRSVGLVLFPVMLITCIFRQKKISASLIAGIFTGALLVVVQILLLPSTASYLQQLPHGIGEWIDLVKRMAEYYIQIGGELIPLNPLILQTTISIVVLLFSLIGLIDKWRKGISAFDFFILFYLVSLLFWPSGQGLRFLLPVVPIYLLYCFIGLESIINFILKKQQQLQIAGMVLFIMIGIYYLNYYSRQLPRPDSSDLTKPATIEMFDFIKTGTAQDDIIAFYKPRALALFTDRRSVAVAGISKCDIILDLQKNNAEFYIVNLRNEADDFQNLDIADPDNYMKVFENLDFQVYKMLYQGKCIKY